MLLLYLFFISSVIIKNDAAKILAVYPSASISHQVPFRPLTLELIKRGHEVTVITPDPIFPKGKAPKNLREIDVHDTAYGFWKAKIGSFATAKKDDMLAQANDGMDFFLNLFEVELRSPQVQELMNNKNETFDLILAEACIRPALAFSHLYKVPVIMVSSFGAFGGVYELIGSPVHPIIYSVFAKYDPSEITWRQKWNEIYSYLYMQDAYYSHEEKENVVVRKYFGKDIPTLSELFNNVQMFFLNVHPIWDDNRPVPPNVIYMGGIHQNPEKELPKDLKSYLDSSKHGVIYFSLGSNVIPSLLSPEKFQILANVFSKLPYDVLWKFDKELPNKPPNVRIEKWLPQSDLLKHPKIKLFITQGGLQSTDEAILAGVPLLGIPIFGDQWMNVDRYVQQKIGVKLNFDEITEESFKNAVDKVIGDESYRRNIQKLRDVMHDQPQRPVDRAVWWVEHVLRHKGGQHLRSPAFNMPWTQYYEIKLVSILLGGLLSVLFVAFYTLYSIWRYLRRNFVATVKVKKR